MRREVPPLKKLLIGLGVILIGTVAVINQRAAIAEKILDRGLEERILTNRINDLDDGLHLALCGAGGPLPGPKASGPCVAVVAGTDLYIVDAGTDGLRNLSRMGYPAGMIDSVFLTHFHSDHIDGLGEMGTIRWAAGQHTEPLPVYGPTGVEQVVTGFNSAYAQDMTYRHAHHGATVVPMSGAGLSAQPFATPKQGELLTVLEKNGLIVEALLVDHTPVHPAVGYKFSYKGRSLLITGDTKQSSNIETLAHGVDLLVHEALAPNLVLKMHSAAKNAGNEGVAKIFVDILDYHASPAEAAQTAKNADVGHLLYYHIVPPMVIPGQEKLWLNGAEAIFPTYTVGEDGVSFSLPANSEVIQQTASGL